MLKRFLMFVVAAAGLLAVAVLANTLRQSSRQISVAALPPIEVDAGSAAQRLSAAIRLRTLSSVGDARLDASEFLALHEHLQAAYPKVHATLKRERVNGLSLLYTWPGRDPQAKPILLMAHQDVVPIAPGTEELWTERPFAGVVKGGHIWGRGAWDDKGNLLAQLEAIEILLTQGFQPRQTVFLAFGADEEVGGRRGAAEIAKLLAARGVKLDFIVDEGLLITEGIMPGLDMPVALIGVAEKGYVSVTLEVSTLPGHSSMPPPPGQSALAVMSGALKRLDEKPFAAQVRAVTREMFETLAPEMHPFNRLVLSNLWLFGSVVRRQLQAQPSTDAMLRTTTALTVMHAGEKDNVLPGRALAVVNFRILPGDSRAMVLEHVRSAVADQRVIVAEQADGNESSAISATASPSYRVIAKTVREIFPGTVVAPGLMIGATDSRHFAAISEQIYRFSPVRARAKDLTRFHGTDERISSANYVEMIRFYHRLLQSAAGT
jgi:carboxypeptidase PM20D1